MSSKNFIEKLYDIVESGNYSSIVGWTRQGTAFKIFDEVAFTTDVMPDFFKSTLYTTFMRQLHYHGFKAVKKSLQLQLPPIKLKGKEGMSLKKYEWMHPSFQQGQVLNIMAIPRCKSPRPRDEDIVPEVAFVEKDMKEERPAKRRCAERQAKTEAVEKLQTKRAAPPSPVCSLTDYAYSMFADVNVDMLYKCLLADTGDEHSFDLTEDFGCTIYV